eukprot:TRINITY_DN703_c0_g1_i2.p1 TRINITY_DN703_c0_g1~~TRINITY_DN703_c0_g1_i2.p1  ORF type:complete len:208 (-),score=31.72 TRINITY_DN703_c0_g1_i2:110-661(-)
MRPHYCVFVVLATLLIAATVAQGQLTAAWEDLDDKYVGVAVILVDITFSEPVTGFDANALTLTEDGDAVQLSAIALTLDQKTYSISLLNDATGDYATYTLTLNGVGSTIVGSVSGSVMTTNPTVTWKQVPPPETKTPKPTQTPNNPTKQPNTPTPTVSDAFLSVPFYSVYVCLLIPAVFRKFL